MVGAMEAARARGANSEVQHIVQGMELGCAWSIALDAKTGGFRMTPGSGAAGPTW
jgi:hypothetical protein